MGNARLGHASILLGLPFHANMKLRPRQSSSRSLDKLTDWWWEQGAYTNMAQLITLTQPLSVCVHWNGYRANTEEITFMTTFTVCNSLEKAIIGN